MAKDIKDYLYLYLGCECEVKVSNDITDKRILNEINEGVLKLAEMGWIKPILRPLSDITEEEMKQIEITDKEFLIANLESGNEPTLTADHLRYLLSKSFDLFNLITEGLAIKKEKI